MDERESMSIMSDDIDSPYAGNDELKKLIYKRGLYAPQNQQNNLIFSAHFARLAQQKEGYPDRKS